MSAMDKEDAEHFLDDAGFIGKTDAFLDRWRECLAPRVREGISEHDWEKLRDIVDGLTSTAAVKASEPATVAKFWSEHTTDPSTTEHAESSGPSEATPQPAATDSTTELLTPQQAAKILTLSPRTLEGMRGSGEGPRYAKLGRGRSGRILYRRADIDAWVASSIRWSTAESLAPSE